MYDSQLLCLPDILVAIASESEIEIRLSGVREALLYFIQDIHCFFLARMISFGPEGCKGSNEGMCFPTLEIYTMICTTPSAAKCTTSISLFKPNRKPQLLILPHEAKE